MKTLCFNCNKIINRPPSKIKRCKFSFCSRKCSNQNPHRKGWHHSPEAKEKLRQFHLGRKQSKETIQKRRETIFKRHGPNWHKGVNHEGWKGGKWKNGYGYIKILIPDHPHADFRGYYFEHRVVMEKHIGRILKKSEWVHHRNGIRDDNRIENLEIVSHAKPAGKVSCPKCQFVFNIH